VLLDVKTTLGEGPVWDVDQQRLYFIDSMDGRVFRTTAQGTEIRTWDVPGKIGSVALRKDGEGAIVSLQGGFHRLDFKTGDCELFHDPEPDLPANRLNDGKTDRRGRFFVGSMDTMEEGPVRLRIDKGPQFKAATGPKDQNTSVFWHMFRQQDAGHAVKVVQAGNMTRDTTSVSSILRGPLARV
jgi:L-arabinonolactonase